MKMSDQRPPGLTDSDHSADDSSDSEMEGTSDYGSKYELLDENVTG